MLSLPLDVFRRYSHDWAACWSNWHISDKFLFDLFGTVTKVLISSTNPDMWVSHLSLLLVLVDVHSEEVSSMVLIKGNMMNVHSLPADSLPWPAPWIGSWVWEYDSFEVPSEVWIWYLVNWRILDWSLQTFFEVPSR